MKSLTCPPVTEETPLPAILLKSWELSPCAIMVTDATGCIEHVNPAFVKLNGYASEELIGGRPDLLRTDDVSEEVYAGLWSTILAGNTWTGRLLNRRKDGSRYWAAVTISPVTGEDGAILHFLSISENVTAEVEAGEAARRTAEENEMLAAQSGMVYWKVDAEGLYTEVSPAAAKVWGYRPDELIGKRHFYDLHAEEHREEIKRVAFAIFKKKEPFVSFLNSIVRPDGRVMWVETNGVPMLDKSGNLCGYVGTDKDVTALKAAQLELATTANLLRSVIDSTPDVIFAKDTRCRILACNKAFAALVGKSPEDLIGKTDLENGWPAELVARYESLDHRALAGETIHIIDSGVGPDGNAAWFDVIKVPMRTADGQIIGVLGVARDITQSRNDAEERNKRDLLIRQAQEIASLGCWEFNPRADKVVMSDETAEMFGFPIKPTGYTFEDLMGYVHPEDQDMVKRTFFASMRDGLKSFEFEHRLIHQETADVLHVRQKCHHRRDADGEVVSSVGVIMDVTSQQNLEQQLRQAQKLESVGRLAGGVAHDFNNMLGVILGHAELLITGLPPGGRIFESLREIQNAANRSAALTRQLLAFARCQPVRPEIIDVNEAISSMIKMLRRMIGENIELVWKPAPRPCRVFIDPSQIDQILANLAVNARDAIGPGGGTLEIRTSFETIRPETRSDFSEIPAGEFVILTVRDTGCGMDGRTLERIFEPFFTTKPSGDGTGLGLSTVFGIVKQNRGSIHVTSEQDEGTTFTIFLPFCPEKAAAGSSEEGKLPTGTETILLVEDESTVLSLAATIIGTLGYKVIPAGSPLEAVRIFNEDPYAIDILVTDVIMPGMNGRELSERLTGFRPELKTLYVSGYTANIIESQGIASDSVAFVQKPFTLREIATQLRKLLG